MPVFFIFVVSNLGGLLTPLGDPPLFLGFLNGVDFLWTFTLLPQWLLANGLVLTLFFLWDVRAIRREPPRPAEATPAAPGGVQGLYNVVFLVGVAVAVLMQSPKLGAACGTWLAQFVPCGPLTLVSPWGEALMVAMALLSLALTPRAVRKANEFSWGAIIEVAVLFAGIFVTMTPALIWLREQGPRFGLTQPWQFFWLSGALSSVLDNAPTYVTFATLAAVPHGDFGWLAHNRPLLLQAVSCGSVFMGANTYIGNGPNLMVKAVAEELGVPHAVVLRLLAVQRPDSTARVRPDDAVVLPARMTERRFRAARRRSPDDPNPEVPMKMIVAVIRPERLEAVQKALNECDVYLMTVSDVRGCGRQRGYTEMYRGTEMQVRLLPKLKLEVAVTDAFVDVTIEAIVHASRSPDMGQVGDGKIFVLPLDDCVRIRTGERGMTAIGP